MDEREITQLRERLSKLEEALIWCSGSDDFAPGGKARKGYERLVQPLLKEMAEREK